MGRRLSRGSSFFSISGGLLQLTSTTQGINLTALGINSSEPEDWSL